jgi:hypothetical protein
MQNTVQTLYSLPVLYSIIVFAGVSNNTVLSTSQEKSLKSVVKISLKLFILYLQQQSAQLLQLQVYIEQSKTM